MADFSVECPYTSCIAKPGEVCINARNGSPMPHGHRDRRQLAKRTAKRRGPAVDRELAGVYGSTPRRLLDLMEGLGFRLEDIHDDSDSRVRLVFSTDPQVGELRKLDPHPGLVYTTITFEDTMERPSG